MRSHRSQILRAMYAPSSLPECAGNPLIEAIPRVVMGSEVLVTFGRRPIFDEAERQLTAAERMFCVSRLNDYLLMMPGHGEILEQVSLLIHSGYVHRNPVDADFKKSQVEFYRQSIGGDIKPIETSGPSTAPSFSLFGVSGMGKSTAIERALSYYPQALSHAKHGFLQLVWLKVDCPMDGSLKQLLGSIIAQIDGVLGTEHAKTIQRGTTIDKLILDVAKIAAQNHLGVLVVDEIQHLLAAPGVGPAKMLNFFVTFANEVKVPLIVLGTPKAKFFLDQLFREARRLSDHGSTFWDRMEPGRDWDYFLKALWKYQWLQNPVELDQPLSQAMYAQTQGIGALVVRLFQLTQLQAIRSRSEKITVSLLRKVAKEQFALLRPALDALRSGQKERVEKFEDLLASGLVELNALTEPQKQVQSIKVATKKLNEKRMRLASNLLQVGADPKLVGILVDRVHSASDIAGAADGSKEFSDPKISKKLVEILIKAEETELDPIEALRAAGLIDDLR